MSNASQPSSDRTNRPLAAFCIVVGIGALWVSRNYDAGTVISMGPGFFPKAVAGLLILLGIIVFLVNGRDVEPSEDPEQPGIGLLSLGRILLFVVGSVVLFGMTLHPLGLPVATFLMVALASAARSGARPVTVILTALVLAIFATLLFAFALQLQMPVYPELLK